MMSIITAQELNTLATTYLETQAAALAAELLLPVETRYKWLFEDMTVAAGRGLYSVDTHLTPQQQVDLKTQLESAGYTVSTIATNVIDPSLFKSTVTNNVYKRLVTDSIDGSNSTLINKTANGFSSNRSYGISNIRISW